MKLLSMPGIFAIILTAHSSVIYAACPPTGFDEEQLSALRESGFEIEDDQARRALALQLADCTSSNDPFLRDQIAFEATSVWLRSQLLDVETIQQLMQVLASQLEGPGDEEGFKRPFAALILSEVARTDRVEPHLSDEQLDVLTTQAAAYLSSVRDYRGYSNEEGWRHGAAHGSDLVLQLVLNPRTNKDQVESLLNAVAMQVSPRTEHFYIYGEPGRLARPAIFAWRRNLFDESWWTAWLERVTDPAPMEHWNQAWSNNEGLARRHNTQAFLTSLYVNAGASGDEGGQALAALVLEAMRKTM